MCATTSLGPASPRRAWGPATAAVSQQSSRKPARTARSRRQQRPEVSQRPIWAGRAGSVRPVTAILVRLAATAALSGQVMASPAGATVVISVASTARMTR